MFRTSSGRSRTARGVLLAVAALLGSAVLLAATGPVLAQDAEQPETKQEKPKKPAKKPEWHPTPPMPEKFDWVQMNSGEWLKGEFIVMYDDKVEFDSDELDMLDLHFEDIRQVLSAQIMQVRCLKQVTATGKLLIEGDVVRVIGEEERQFKRSEIVSIVAGEPKEINYWSAKLTLGANFRQGNSEQVEYNGRVRIQRRTVQNRINFEYLGNYNITDDVLATNNHRATLGWDKFLTDRFFVYPVAGEYFRDPFLNIASRWTLGAGVGYQLIDTKKIELQFSGGPGYQETHFDDVAVDEPQDESTPALVGSTNLAVEMTESIDFDWDYRFQITNEVSGSYNHHMVTGFEIELTSLFDLDLSFVWDRIKDPRQNSDGTFPKSNDYRLIVGVTLDF